MEQFSNQLLKIKIAHKWLKRTMGNTDSVRLFFLWTTHTHTEYIDMCERCFQYYAIRIDTEYGVSVCANSGKSVCGTSDGRKDSREWNMYSDALFNCSRVFFLLILLVSLSSALISFCCICDASLQTYHSSYARRAAIRRFNGVFFRVIVKTRTVANIVRTH